MDLGMLSVLKSANSRFLIHTAPDNFAQLLKLMERDLPDVVMLSQGSRTARHNLFGNLLTASHSIRILTFCTESNHVLINHCQIARIHKISDILDLIHSNPYGPLDSLEKR